MALTRCEELINDAAKRTVIKSRRVSRKGALYMDAKEVSKSHEFIALCRKGICIMEKLKIEGLLNNQIAKG